MWQFAVSVTKILYSVMQGAAQGWQECTYKTGTHFEGRGAAAFVPEGPALLVGAAARLPSAFLSTCGPGRILLGQAGYFWAGTSAS